MTYKKTARFIVILFFFCTGCNAAPAATPTIALPAFVTATLPPTAIPAATATPLPPTVVPTVTPIAGRTTTEVNVRENTSTASNSLGTLPAFSPVQITGRDASGLWVQIVFNDRTGWVRADYVQVDDASAEIPVLGSGAGSGSAGRGVVLSGVNVRSGPGKDFESLGLLNQNDVVSILGKDSAGAWFQIEYAPSVEGTGWVAAEFLQVENAEAVAVVNAEPQATETVVSDPAVSVPSTQIARAEGDTAGAPLAMFTLSADAVATTQFSGEVSTPGGDGEDWIGFSANGTRIAIQVLCESDALKVELTQPDGAPGAFSAGCNEAAHVIKVMPGQVYLLRVLPTVADVQTLIAYKLQLKFIGP